MRGNLSQHDLPRAPLTRNSLCEFRTYPRKRGEVDSRMPPRQPQPGLDLGDLGAADGHAMR
ncbi:MAG: hypothetical protein JWR80_7781 [Bradyrhizobium sp.]|nr:hypothetical protein [Bradyrhizobium sp.]